MRILDIDLQHIFNTMSEEELKKVEDALINVKMEVGFQKYKSALSSLTPENESPIWYQNNPLFRTCTLHKVIESIVGPERASILNDKSAIDSIKDEDEKMRASFNYDPRVEGLLRAIPERDIEELTRRALVMKSGKESDIHEIMEAKGYAKDLVQSISKEALKEKRMQFEELRNKPSTKYLNVEREVEATAKSIFGIDKLDYARGGLKLQMVDFAEAFEDREKELESKPKSSFSNRIKNFFANIFSKKEKQQTLPEAQSNVKDTNWKDSIKYSVSKSSATQVQSEVQPEKNNSNIEHDDLSL